MRVWSRTLNNLGEEGRYWRSDKQCSAPCSRDIRKAEHRPIAFLLLRRNGDIFDDRHEFSHARHGAPSRRDCAADARRNCFNSDHACGDRLGRKLLLLHPDRQPKPRRRYGSLLSRHLPLSAAAVARRARASIRLTANGAPPNLAEYGNAARLSSWRVCECSPVDHEETMEIVRGGRGDAVPVAG